MGAAGLPQVLARLFTVLRVSIDERREIGEVAAASCWLAPGAFTSPLRFGNKSAWLIPYKRYVYGDSFQAACFGRPEAEMREGLPGKAPAGSER